ncbi:zinc finger protein 723-like [Maniola hyperantus]|uniref:zinc finger protein 723-like n=1 Tax=Aphantopus hyperantus TaxID=2795564 RepID=UPI001567C876|nr:zinc finger protein 846-like [Maniola hyperantus]
MDSSIMVETLPIFGTCSLCLVEGVVKSMLIKQITTNKTESYTDMLLKCFAIDMSALDLDDTKRLICDICIQQLETCLEFKQQVEVSLKTLEETVKLKQADQQMRIKVEVDADTKTNDTKTKRRLRDVKKELASAIGLSNDNYIDNDSDNERLVFSNVKQESLDDSDFDDHTILNDLLIKKEVDEYRPRTRQKARKKTLSTKKKKISYSTKRQVDLNDTKKMLQSGLFPFKINKNQIYCCAVCPEKSAVLDDIKSHIMEHNISNISLAFKKMLSSNLQIFYKSSQKLGCKICSNEISDYDNLKRHINSCVNSSSRWNNLPFKLEKDQLDCPICKKTFLNFVSLNTHMNVHYPNHICDSCGKAFASKARLRGHIRTHEIGDFPCKYCDAVFDRVTKRENHVSKEHKSGIRYACKRCNISLTSFYARQKHLAEVHNEELKRYKCKACPQSYITPGHLSSHVRRDHLNERNHKCNKCDLAFYTRNSLKMHMIKHDGERIHACNICNKSYQRKKTLREHMRIHTNDKRFVCPVCGRAFTQKCTLKGHLKVHERKVDLDDRIPQPLHSI